MNQQESLSRDFWVGRFSVLEDYFLRRSGQREEYMRKCWRGLEESFDRLGMVARLERVRMYVNGKFQNETERNRTDVDANDSGL